MRIRTVITAIFLVIFSSLLHSQENLILHRVYIAPVTVSPGFSPDGLFLSAPETLFNLINTRQPLIRSSEEEANSIIRTEILPAENVESAVELRFTLLRNDEALHVSVGVFQDGFNFEDYRNFLEECVGDFAPELGRVEPRIELIRLETDADTRRLLDQLIYADALQTPFEATLWTGILSKNPDGEDGKPLYLHFPLHYYGEFTWFPNQGHHGLTASLFFEYSDYTYHADSVINTDEPGRSDNLYLLPGIGYTYRTSGEFSAGFYSGLNVGGLRIHAREDLTWDGGLSLQENESEWVLMHYLVMRPYVAWALNESWTLKTSFALYISLLQLFPNPLQTDYYRAGDPGAEIQFVNLGVSYRWR